MAVTCPNCGKSRPYLLVCPQCGWVGCEKELKKQGFYSYCPNCGSRITSANRIKDPRLAYEKFAQFYCRGGRGFTIF